MRMFFANNAIWASIPWSSTRQLRSALLLAGLSSCTLLGCATETSQGGNGTVKSGPSIPLPPQALLEPQPTPNCALKTADNKAGESREVANARAAPRFANLAIGESARDAAGSALMPAPSSAPPRPTLTQSQPDAGLGQRIKLEYERNCYQGAEVRVRDRLLQLQTAVRKIVRAVRRSD